MLIHGFQSAAFRLPSRAAATPRAPELPPEEAFIRQAVPQGNPRELAFFYDFGRKFYGEGQSQEELLGESLRGLQKWLDEPWEGSALATMSRPERLAMLEKLVVAAPPLQKDYVLSHGDVLRPLQFIREIVTTDETVPNTVAHLGPNEQVRFQLSPPARRLTLEEGVDHYLGYLDRILHASGRVDPTKQLNEDHAAWNCLAIEQNVLHGDARQVEMFQNLVSYYHSPWPALAVLQQANLVPEDKQKIYLDRLQSQVEQFREQRGAPENSQDHAREGDYVGQMSKYLGLVVRAQRPGEALEEVETDLGRARGELKGLVARYRGVEALAEALSMRGENESLTAATRRLQTLFELVDQLFPASSTDDQLQLAGQIGRRDPERAAEFQECVQYLKRLNPPAEHVLPALKSAYEAEGSPLEALQERFRSLELTGRMEGLDEVRRELDDAIRDGRLKGTPEQLFSRFLERLRSLNLVHDDHKVSFATAREEFFQGPASNQIGYQNGRLTIGGVRVQQRRPYLSQG